MAGTHYVSNWQQRQQGVFCAVASSQGRPVLIWLDVAPNGWVLRYPSAVEGERGREYMLLGVERFSHAAGLARAHLLEHGITL